MLNRRGSADAALVVGFVVVLVGGICFLCWLIPTYNVWRREMAGKGQLAEAEWNRKITVQEAESKLQAASSLAKAEIERAKGVAEANKIIGESLKDNEAYLRYLWVNGMNDQDNHSVIYVPTETGMPIMEAGRRAPQKLTPRPE